MPRPDRRQTALRAPSRGYVTSVPARTHDAPAYALSSRLLAEAIGTFVVVLAAICVDVSYFSGSGADYTARWLTRAFVTAAAIYAFSDISGAHLNPAVTFGFALRGVFRWPVAFAFAGAQLAGAAAATLLAFVPYGAHVAFGASRPGPGIAPALAGGCELVLTFIVMLVIFCTAEQQAVVGKQAAIAVGLAVGACGFLAGPISGASMNPARSIVPELLTGQPAFVWIYLIGPLAGAALATGAMYLLCGRPNRDERRAARGR